MKEYKITFCGCGAITGAWLWTIQKLNEVQDDYNLNIIAACDPNPKMLRKLRRFGFKETKKFSDVEQAYKEEKSDITIITCPPQLHARYLNKAIENDNHVITEKPFLVDYNQYRHMRQLADIVDEKKLHAVVNQQYRWNEDIAGVRKAIEQQVVGEIDFVVSNFSQDRYHFDEWWRSQHEDMSQYNWYIHHYDAMRYMLGKNPVTVRAKLHRPRWSKIYGESTIFLNVTFEDGIEWSYTATQESVEAPNISKHTSFIMYGSKGTIRHLKDTNPRAYIEDKNKSKGINSIRVKKFLDEGERFETEEFGDGRWASGWDTTLKFLLYSIETGKSHPTCLRDNFWTIAIPLCARESHKQGNVPIDVKEYMELD